MKIREIYRIVCPICGNKPRIVDKSVWGPTLYCEEDKLKIECIRKGWAKYYYKIDDLEFDQEFCEIHNEIFDSKEKCSVCEDQIIVKKFREQKFTEQQIKYLKTFKYNYELSKVIDNFEKEK